MGININFKMKFAALIAAVAANQYDSMNEDELLVSLESTLSSAQRSEARGDGDADWTGRWAPPRQVSKLPRRTDPRGSCLARSSALVLQERSIRHRVTVPVVTTCVVSLIIK